MPSNLLGIHLKCLVYTCMLPNDVYGDAVTHYASELTCVFKFCFCNLIVEAQNLF